jgi:hypothetical protein
LDTKLARAWDSGHISVGALWALYAQYPYLARMKNREVLVTAVRDVVTQFTWEAEGFALADSFDASTGLYSGLVIPGGGAVAGAITDATMLVKPSVALAQTPQAPVGVDASDSGSSPGARVAPASTESSREGPAYGRYYGAATVAADRYSRDFNRISQEVLQHIAAIDGIELDITVEISARCPEGFPDDKVRVILENARALKFDQSSFESG